ncbi:hypothetical protein BV898_00605 [Hypsibius exemplaris]|uniref:Chitin-binding type-2 domain-containing protein n=1 Tax=Hypsibius exemplaris TaxID=2072580 RepID=A0A1W0XDX6_HYPEX|nr:hypothetical protein BV898_00605 [Hypsibius exemplaris]
MIFLVVASAFVSVAMGQDQQTFTGQQNNRLVGKFVYDLLKPPLTAAEVQTIMTSRDANNYPQYNTIPQTNFSCGQKNQAGFYADVEAQCQLWHRCDLAGKQTNYLCTNSTVFNQITLVCDSWYNVDCQRSIELEDFANSRLYTNQPLFDSPPADYVSPSQLVLLQNQGLIAQQQIQASPAIQQQKPQTVIVNRA